jgi:predicted Rossmann fold nucleotide-binding protein DprA/Smf involved in DNA uptake
MGYVLLSLLVVSTLLLILSFFVKDPIKELKNEVDQLSLNQIQELYQMKRKIKILEEELLVSDSDFASTTSQKREVHAILKNQVWSLSQQGLSMDQIAKQSSLPIEDVEMILNEYSMRGEIYE